MFGAVVFDEVAASFANASASSFLCMPMWALNFLMMLRDLLKVRQKP